ncbi:MAG: glycosyltransferase, partial [Mariprofundaceae bacterium]|nr:glycosyltransferase [Mariprofundaceae bacterium]
MAVYNGQHFIEQQLDSICSQKNQDWNLYIRDDASCDASLSIVENFAKENSRVDIIENLEGNLGAKKSFVSLLESKQLEPYSYVAFSDQDDVWAQDKLLRQSEEMYKLEGAFPNTPLLVYSDMEVV